MKCEYTKLSRIDEQSLQSRSTDNLWENEGSDEDSSGLILAQFKQLGWDKCVCSFIGSSLIGDVVPSSLFAASSS